MRKIKRAFAEEQKTAALFMGLNIFKSMSFIKNFLFGDDETVATLFYCICYLKEEPMWSWKDLASYISISYLPERRNNLVKRCDSVAQLLLPHLHNPPKICYSDGDENPTTHMIYSMKKLVFLFKCNKESHGEIIAEEGQCVLASYG